MRYLTLRRYGCTRVQLGVQHTDDDILAKINRGHGTSHTAAALARLKNSCYKVDIHLMPQLPAATLECDRKMFERVLSDPALQADQWKIYPTQVIANTHATSYNCQEPVTIRLSCPLSVE